MGGKSLELICWCGSHYFAREADVSRGWGLSCSKSHAAIRRDYGKPKAKRVDGVEIKRVRKKKRGAKRLTPDARSIPKMFQSDGIHPIGYGHIMASGDEGHGQE